MARDGCRRDPWGMTEQTEEPRQEEPRHEEPRHEEPRPIHPPLRRSKQDRVIAGVCGGIARSLGIDPVIVRVVAAAFALAGGAGIIAYLIAWLVIPDDDGVSVVEDASVNGSRGRKLFLAIALAALGLGAIASLTGGNHGTVGFLIFVIIGLVVWQAFGTDWLTGGAPMRDWVNPGGPATGDATARRQAAADAWTERRRERSVLGVFVFNAVVLAVGIMLVLNFADLTQLSTRTFLAVALAIVGLGLVVSAFVGRGRGLIALGLVIGLLTLPAGVDTHNVAGTRSWLPVATAGSSASAYDLGLGDATLDLRPAVAGMTAADSLQVTAHVGVGQLVVLIPTNTEARYELRLRDDIGDMVYPGQTQRSGLNNEDIVTIGGDTTGPVISLDLRVDVGHLEVRYA